jgi:Fe-S cluster assembly protein SufD
MTIQPTNIRQAGTPAEQRFIDLYADVADRLPGAAHPQVRAWREAGIDTFATLGLPHRRVEEWKYTDLRVLMPEVYPLAGLTPQVMADVSLDLVLGEPLNGLDAYRAVFVNGLFRADLSNVGGARGLVFNSFRAGVAGESATDVLAALSPQAGDVVSALSAAFATDGALIVAEDGAKLDKPIHMICVTTAEAPVAVALRNAVRVGKGAQLTLIETHVSTVPSHLYAATNIVVGEGAHLRHLRINLGQRDKHLSTLIAELAAGAQYDPLQFTAGGGLVRAQGFIRFGGKAGRCHYTGAMMHRGSEHGDITLVVEHAAEGCESRELVKAVLDDRAKGVFQAKVLVQRGAQQTDGKQMSNALLLSNDAEFDAKPELEIYADDVTCGHGATAGQLDDDMMFYLRARGIPEAQARAMLIVAFIGEALDKIEDENLRETLVAEAEAWLGA